MNVYLEIGEKRTFAAAIDWPGWCRSGKDAQLALEALAAYGSRYAAVLSATHLDFQAPVSSEEFNVVERIVGNATTDFGAPGKIPVVDNDSVDDLQVKRLRELLKACWQTFDCIANFAAGKDLRKGPRGGGRDLESIIHHVIDADVAYIRKVGWNFKIESNYEWKVEFPRTRQAVFQALESAAHGELSAAGPRGGKLWLPRYFVRRVAWHVLDHAWEIEDRLN